MTSRAPPSHSIPPLPPDPQDAPFQLPYHFQKYSDTVGQADGRLPFNYITWNARGWFTRKDGVFGAKLNQALRLLRMCPVLCITESHTNHEDVPDVEKWCRKYGLVAFYGFNINAERLRCDAEKEAPPPARAGSCSSFGHTWLIGITLKR